MQRKSVVGWFILCLAVLLFLSLNKHSKDKANSYHGVIWADAAGYFVYQPMWFIYGNNPAAFPDSVEAHTGYGFSLDRVSNRIITKYPCGTALLQSPFFLVCHFLAKPLGFEANGFSRIYSFGLYFSGIFYCAAGLFLLYGFLIRYFSRAVSVAAPLLIFAGTNLFYYSIDMPGMSHVYSFFLFCFIVNITPSLLEKNNFTYWLMFFCCMVLIGLTRPTNVIIALFPLFYNIRNKLELKERFQLILGKKFIALSAALLSLLLALPQFIYWYKTTGNLITYSYGNEGFINWNSPKLIEVWFSTKNGLFPYTPLALLCLVGIIVMIKSGRKIEAYFIACKFLVISYLFASWWCWWFGCAFGARSFIEYYALLIIPFAYFIEYGFKHKYYRYITAACILFCCYLNMDMEYYYDGCFYGETWDFATYLKLLNS
ncbi:MAG: hypothetical protein WAQ28_00245 [Bacteroidia bacterium]|jgi:hypothetical protein